MSFKPNQHYSYHNPPFLKKKSTLSIFLEEFAVTANYRFSKRKAIIDLSSPRDYTKLLILDKQMLSHYTKVNKQGAKIIR